MATTYFAYRNRGNVTCNNLIVMSVLLLLVVLLMLIVLLMLMALMTLKSPNVMMETVVFLVFE